MIGKAVEVLKSGGVIVYPTETCYGLGADATNPEAIRKVFKIKNRSLSKPMHILVADLEMAGWYCEITPDIMDLVESGLGPLNIVARKKSTIPDALNPDEICFRIPTHPVALEIVRTFGKPITATSANISGEPVIYNVDDVRSQFEGKVASMNEGQAMDLTPSHSVPCRVDLIINSGDLPENEPATIVDMKGEPRIVREGSVSLDDIKRVLK